MAPWLIALMVGISFGGFLAVAGALFALAFRVADAVSSGGTFHFAAYAATIGVGGGVIAAIVTALISVFA